jgi:hypothetical protein
MRISRDPGLACGASCPWSLSQSADWRIAARLRRTTCTMANRLCSFAFETVALLGHELRTMDLRA